MTWFGGEVPRLEQIRVLCKQICGCTHNVYFRVDILYGPPLLLDSKSGVRLRKYDQCLA